MTTYYKDNKEYTYREALALTGANFKEVDKNIAVFIREGFEVVGVTPKPTCGELEQAKRIGTELDANGNRVQAWIVQDMFEDTQRITYDENGQIVLDGFNNPTYTTVTKLEQEEAYLARKFKDSVPDVISMRQARLALLGANLLTTVDTAIANSTDNVLKIEWEYATEVRRDWTNLINLATILGMTELDLDNLFIAGKEL